MRMDLPRVVPQVHAMADARRSTKMQKADTGFSWEMEWERDVEARRSVLASEVTVRVVVVR